MLALFEACLSHGEGVILFCFAVLGVDPGPRNTQQTLHGYTVLFSASCWTHVFPRDLQDQKKKWHLGKNIMESRRVRVCGIVRGNFQPVLPWSLSERKTWVFPHQGKLDTVHRGPLRLLRRHETFMAGLLQKEALCKEDTQVSV